MNRNHFGKLYVVATPIGNLGDMTQRAIEVLKTVDFVAAEDTRHSKPLLQHFAVSTPLIALHDHNERDKTLEILKLLQGGKSLALISDAGTPLVSDPGFFLTRAVLDAGITVVPVPGACAAIAALSASGLPTDRFTFEGFLPAKDSQRKERLEALRNETRTMIFYEAPHRVLTTLQAMQKIFGEARQAVLAREITKLYETIHAAPLGELTTWVAKDANQQRGEIVLLVAGAEAQPEVDNYHLSADELLKILLADLPLKQAVDLAAKISGGRKNDLYQRALALKQSN